MSQGTRGSGHGGRGHGDSGQGAGSRGGGGSVTTPGAPNAQPAGRRFPGMPQAAPIPRRAESNFGPEPGAGFQTQAGDGEGLSRGLFIGQNQGQCLV